MSWRSIQSAAGDGVPLDVRLGLTWEPRNLGSKWLLAVCRDERWCAQSTRHRGQAVRCHVSCLDVVLQSFLLDVSWTITPFRMNCFLLVRWLLLYRSLLVSLLCHWLVGRALFVEVDREGGDWESGLLWWLRCCWLGRSVDWCTDRRRRAAMWVSPQSGFNLKYFYH